MVSSTPDVRFHATLAVVCTFAFVQLLLATLVQSGVLWYSPLSWVVTVYIIIIYQWNKLFGLYLSRKFRTLFDEMNILETYQPRAWTMGYLFEAEPPTPFPDGQSNTNPEADKFRALRDAHYANEFNYVQKMEAERKMLEQSGNSKQPVLKHVIPTGTSEVTRIELREEPKDDQDSYREI